MKTLKRLVVCFLTLLVLIAYSRMASAEAKVFDGPYFGEVVRVVDGDNFEAKIEIWPTISATVSVRIKGIDAPEYFRPGCAQERLGAVDAFADLQSLLPVGTQIRLEAVEADSFSGRVLAVAFRQGEERGRKLDELLLNRGNVEPWDGSEAIDWCAGAD